jgi:hypothetical protein
METRTEENFSISFSYSEEAVERARACEGQFISLLSSYEKRVYDQFMLPVLMPDLISSQDRFIQKFNAKFAKRWITKRAYDYGWNDKRFPHDRRQYEMNRERPKIERIGKNINGLHCPNSLHA